jgi:hypothetical protein
VAELAEGWREFASRAWLWIVVAWASVYLLMVVAPLHVLGPVVADRDLRGARDWGLIAAAEGFGVVCGSALAVRLRFARPMFVAVVLGVGPGVFALSLALTLPVVAIAAIGLIAGATHGIFEVVWITALQQRVAPAALARVSAWDALGSFIFMPLGFALAGPAAEAVGTPDVLLVVAGFAVASSLVVAALPAVRGFRRLEEPRYNVA